VDRKDPRVSPLYADLRDFPPILIQVGSDETLLDDATRLAAVVGAADVPVTLEIWPHMIHAWPLWNAYLEPGRRALANAGSVYAATSLGWGQLTPIALAVWVNRRYHPTGQSANNPTVVISLWVTSDTDTLQFRSNRVCGSRLDCRPTSAPPDRL
jgi:acetyl esterase/lipase